MVEFEHSWICVAAIDTGIGSEVGIHRFPSGSDSIAPRLLDLVEVQLTPIAEVLPEAVTAPPLAASAVSVEVRVKEDPEASPTCPQFRRLRRFGRLRANCASAARPFAFGRREIAHPEAHRGQPHPDLSSNPAEGPAELSKLSCSGPLRRFADHERMFANRPDGTAQVPP
jgi:hypothetical protein